MDLIKRIWETYTKDISSKSKDDWYNQIIRRYNDENRKYYNMQNLLSKLEHFTNIEENLKDKGSFVLALYFQYFQYDPKDSTLINTNIEFFQAFASDVGIKDSMLYSGTMSLLKASDGNITEEHTMVGAYGHEDKHYFLDIDVAFLGAPPDMYKHYVEQIRQDYHFLSDKEFKALRQKVLQSFLQIPNIYTTEHFRGTFELQASSNIIDELSRIGTD